jgi:hypothetical protein
MFIVFFITLNRDYAAASSAAVPKWLFENLWPAKISQEVIFSKPTLPADSKLAQTEAKIQFFPDLRNANAWATRCSPAGKPMNANPTPPGNGEPGERTRPHVYPTAGRGKYYGINLDRRSVAICCDPGIIRNLKTFHIQSISTFFDPMASCHSPGNQASFNRGHLKPSSPRSP